MKCQQCVDGGKRSTVTVGPSSTTCMMGWEGYDEDGQHHRHNPNKSSTNYRCSNGHSWCTETGRMCPVDGCSWNDT